ncbi:MAG: hypothetical protein QOK38_1109 [Acidobacteriaceae bacterium]|jgi:hypothetical protein|nr:hypothetical protein [Acidobacteriaceae bacterium]
MAQKILGRHANFAQPMSGNSFPGLLRSLRSLTSSGRGMFCGSAVIADKTSAQFEATYLSFGLLPTSSRCAPRQ